MKKTILIALLLICALPVFSSGWLTLETGPTFSWGSYTYTSEQTRYSNIHYVVTAAGETDFGEHAGINYKLKAAFPLDTVENAIITSKAPSFSFELIGLYKAYLTRKLELAVGGGAYFGFRLTSASGSKYRSYQIGVLADLSLGYDVTSSLLLRGGVQISTPLSTYYKQTVNGVSEPTARLSDISVSLTPYIGFGIRY